jgi:predicted SAM-dependent methyltransferase
MNKILSRDNCVVCKSNDLKRILSIESMPVYMGVVEENNNYIFEDMTFSKCNNCNEIQLDRLMDLDVVYSHNHNTEIVGNLWKKHYDEFIKFLGDVSGKTILEIGDPSAKIAKLIDTYKKWIIVEKNPNLESSDKIFFDKKFFNNDFTIEDKIDIIVHSHLLEHIYVPIDFFKKCRDILSDNGSMFFSIPNMKFSLENKFSPNAILQFEHTYYIDEYYLQKICDVTGFEIVNKMYYDGHSVFYQLNKSEIRNTEYLNNYVSNNYIDLYNLHLDKIKDINNSLCKSNIFLYGAHITSQFYIFNGLNCDSIIGILDGSISKQEKYLYGTNLKTFDPNIISTFDDVTVIVSHMGIYDKEISEFLQKINNRVTIL